MELGGADVGRIRLDLQFVRKGQKSASNRTCFFQYANSSLRATNARTARTRISRTTEIPKLKRGCETNTQRWLGSFSPALIVDDLALAEGKTV